MKPLMTEDECDWWWRRRARSSPGQATVGSLRRVALGDLPRIPPRGPPAPLNLGWVNLHDLHFIQLGERRDGKLTGRVGTDKATVLRIRRADLAWLERAGDDSLM